MASYATWSKTKKTKKLRTSLIKMSASDILRNVFSVCSGLHIRVFRPYLSHSRQFAWANLFIPLKLFVLAFRVLGTHTHTQHIYSLNPCLKLHLHTKIFCFHCAWALIATSFLFCVPYALNSMYATTHRRPVTSNDKSITSLFSGHRNIREKRL
jgi:hypothetical protein